MVADAFFYKVRHFTNPRCRQASFSPYVYREDEKDLFQISVAKDRGGFQSLARWFELFQQGMADRTIRRLGLSESDSYAARLMLSRFGHLFQIDNRQRLDKDIHIFFYVFQLMFLKNGGIDRSELHINHFFRMLCFELGMDDEAYEKFQVSGNRLMFLTEGRGCIDFRDFVQDFHEAAQTERERRARHEACLFQLAVMDFLFGDGDAFNGFEVDDTYRHLMSPAVFVRAYRQSRSSVFDALAGCFDGHQSGANLLVANMILMNYAYYVLSRNGRSILALERYLADDALFSSILSALAYRGVGVDKGFFDRMGLADRLIVPDREKIMLYNLIYSMAPSGVVPERSDKRGVFFR